MLKNNIFLNFDTYSINVSLVTAFYKKADCTYEYFYLNNLQETFYIRTAENIQILEAYLFGLEEE